MTRPRAIAAIAATAAAVIIGGGGYALAAATQGGPPTNSTPGPYFQQGAAVNLCVSSTNESQLYVELRSQKLGNCAAGFTQLTIQADPSAIPTSSS